MALLLPSMEVALLLLTYIRLWKPLLLPPRQSQLSDTQNFDSHKYLSETAMKLMKVPSLKRMISSPRADTQSDFNACSASSVSEKGHFNVYTTEGKRFIVPLAYLYNKIFKELLRISEEEFGLPCDGPITLPCDAASMEYVLSLLRRGVSKEIEMQLLSSIFIYCQSTCSMLAVENPQQIAVQPS
ncbi:auxin-responsive protein SAUR68-like [Dioscorea cayenensis subsp. rotundata]|uniref:Auxin-responsive protein SAUR68-like n=1 Tax=Dioscorea cayennensis subsp. rotundata TaxID=55577 RepID=A0AB40BIJ6_DIOCR|nr:auxin-responsive protein SAUR68-like [Dioscorea cayenensis subsp. rotundata]